MPKTMFLETVKSEGLAHLSYLVGHGEEAAVIDPRRDCEVYVERARGRGARITHIFETHRNEDYVIGSSDLQRRTGAQIHHGAAQVADYAQSVSEGDEFAFGKLRLRVLETPGHTYDSISLVLSDASNGDDPLAAFTGDALFVGDVGRTDFFPDRRQEVAALLHESLHEKLLPLGEHVILCPAHGAGSVCGSNLAPREFSTLGYERRHNERLRMGRDEFVGFKARENHHFPPYFHTMERYNQEGAPPLDRLPVPQPLPPQAFENAMERGLMVLDARSPEAFAGAFIPGTLCCPLDAIPSYAGYFLEYDRPIGLIVERPEEIESALRYLVRMGFDDVQAVLAGGLTAWQTSGREFDHVPAVTARDLKERMEAGTDFTLLDVRGAEEFAEQHLPGALNVYLGDLPGRLDEIPRDRPITTLCSSGMRSMIAASILKARGFARVEENFGSMQACRHAGCPMEG